MNNESTTRPARHSDESDQVVTRVAGSGVVAPTGGDTQASGAAEEAPAPKSKAKPKPVITTVEELLTFAYESNARLLEFSKEALKKLPIADEDIPSQSVLIASLAPADPTMSAPFKLLQFVARQGVELGRPGDGGLAPALNRLVKLAIVALGHNPLFRVWLDQLVDPRNQPSLGTQHLREEARRLDIERLGMTSVDRQRLLKNATVCLGLLRSLQREWTLDQFLDELYASVWQYEAPEAAGVERAAGEVGASRDLAVLGIVGSNYLARIARLERRISQLERDAASASSRETRLRQELASASDREEAASARATAFSAEVVRLQKELAAERDNRVVDKSHMTDDYETLRTRIIRRLGGEIDLLSDGLHALRNGAPTVAEEFLDRSLLALTREVEQLKDPSGGLA